MINIKITKIKRHIYFDSSIENYKIINEQYYKAIIELMSDALKLKDKEVLLMMRNSDYCKVKVTNFLKDKVFLSTDMENALLEDNEITYSAFHNHPSNNNFSTDDINILLKYDKLLAICVCTNNCKHITLLIKTRKLTDGDKSIIRDTELDFNNNITIKKLEEHGLFYIHRYN